ncbi:MAG: fumarate reductase subunit C [Acidimicrobiia bacterium]
MNDGPPGYTSYHPRWLRRRVSTYWWLKRPAYLAFILREVSCVFVAWFVIFFLLLVRAVGRGDPAYQRFLEWSGTPLVLAVNVVSLLFVVYHAITWFNLAPKAISVRIRGRRVPPFWIAAPNFLAWAFASAVVVWLMLGG